jgi:hypothetical protein
MLKMKVELRGQALCLRERVKVWDVCEKSADELRMGSLTEGTQKGKKEVRQSQNTLALRATQKTLELIQCFLSST